MTELTRESLLLRSVYLFHREKMNIQMIGRKLGISRFRVSRYLKEAEETGIVKIEINDDKLSYESLAFFDSEACEIDSEFKERAISLGFDDFRTIPERIVLAGGWRKTECIRGLLKSGLISTIIMDSITASELVNDTTQKEHE